MSDELIIHFDTPAQFKVRYDSDETELLPFHSPINDAEYQDIRWYLEKYATDYTSEPDDDRAVRVAEKLPKWGEALFDAVFTDSTARRFFTRLQDSEENERYITLSSVLPEILSLPWEVLRDPHGAYLFNENPRIAIRRSFKSRGGRPARKVKTKKTLHLLFIVSRPEGAGFIDPRMEAKTILHALQVQHIQVAVEFLRRATLKTLIERLENTELPPVDIVHFDGHGVFDSTGGLACRSVDSTETKKDQTAVKNMGYLLFEDEQGKKDLVSADTLGEMLHQQQVSMMVLSACQSAQVAGEDAMGSVAARLVHAGIPTVLAMTHSVLVVTTELLFKKFYEEIAKGHRIGEALENARRTLFRETTRHTKRFGDREVVVKLQDWFIPSLYQTGSDVPLLQRSEEKLPTVAPLHNLPALQEVGFFGRARELWELEQWLLRGTRRVTISGFGGQGKTYLASELARWLLQKQWFERAVFVSYQAFQGVDAVGLAVSCCAEVCQVSLLDADAVTAQLSQHPTLLILDNVESVTGAELQKLLSVAAQWSEVGETRVLVTTRPEIVLHLAFPTAHSERHRLLHLAGLRADDAVNYLQRLLRLPPETKVRAKYDDLVRLLWVVRNHPLSIPMIAQALRTQRLETVETRLRELTVASPDNPVVASLQLSLEKLDAEVQQWLPLLGVFEGGALQKLLVDITELSDEQLSKLQSALITTGLIHPIDIAENYTYWQFHPTLAPVLWSRLDPTQQAPLRQRYQHRSYAVECRIYKGFCR
jgi:CHAT domain/NACHT domain